jgi:GAF domain-containing protein
LDRQTASAEILRAIRQSQTDVQPVFEAIIRNAVRLCGVSHGGVYRFDGVLVHSVAHEGYTAEELARWQALFPRPAADVADSSVVRAIATRSVSLIDDVAEGGLSAEARANLLSRGMRSVLSVPMLRRGDPSAASAWRTAASAGSPTPTSSC